MKILSRPKNNAEEYGKWAVNAYIGCPHRCHYCVSPDTLVFMADGTSKRIDDVQVGDEIYGVERQDTGKYAIARAKVTAKAEVTKKPYRLTFSNGQHVVCSGDHRFLTDRGWKHTTGTERGRYRRPFLTENNHMVCIPVYPTVEFDVTDDYRRGYLSGIIRGDANLAEYHYEDRESIYAFRLALKEQEAIDRTSEYLAHFGIEVREFGFPMVDRKTKETVNHKAIRKNGVYNYEKIQSLIEWDTDNREWLRGFMAGIYDAEGCKDRAKRMSNSNQQIIDTYCLALEKFGFDYTFDKPEQKSSGKLVQVVRLKGGLLTSLLFLRTCRPAITSLFDFEGYRLKFTEPPVHLVEKKKLTNPARLIDIETTTGNFFANGIVAHNCYLSQGPSAGYLGQPQAVLKKDVLSNNHAYHLAMTEIIEHKDEIIRDGGLFFTFTSDPLLPETRNLSLTIASDAAYQMRIPVMLLTKDATFLNLDSFTEQILGFDKTEQWSRSIPFYHTGHGRLNFIDNPHFTSDPAPIAFGFTLTGHDELEPKASPNADRIRAMSDLSAAGFKTWASIEPVIDFRRSYRMIEQALDAGCQHFKIGLMTRGTKVCRRGFTLGDQTFEPYDPARCLAFVQDVMRLTRDRATVYWKQSFRDFIGGTPKHRLFSDDELHKIFDGWHNAVGKDWSMFSK